MSVGTLNRKPSSTTPQRTPSGPSTEAAASTAKPASTSATTSISTPSASPEPQAGTSKTNMLQPNVFKPLEGGPSPATTQKGKLDRAKRPAQSKGEITVKTSALKDQASRQEVDGLFTAKTPENMAKFDAMIPSRPQSSALNPSNSSPQVANTPAPVRPSPLWLATRALVKSDPVVTLPVTDKGEGMVQVGNNDYKVGREIGKGGMGKVQLLEPSTKGAEPLVIKTGMAITHEAEMHAAAGNHPNIAQFKGSGKVDGKDALMMEHVGGGDLQQNLAALRKKYDQGKLSHSEYMGTTQYLMKGTLQGLQHAETNGIVHRDIKPENILLDDKTLQPKLADFGIAQRTGVKSDGLARPFASPERLKTEVTMSGLVTPFSTASGKDDIWSVGQMTHEAGEKKLFGGEASGELALAALLGDFAKNPDNKALQKPANTAYTDFVNKMLAPTAGQRPSANEALMHPFLKDPLISDEQAQGVLKKLINEHAGRAPSRPTTPAPDFDRHAAHRPLPLGPTVELLEQTKGIRKAVDAEAAARTKDVAKRTK